VQIRKRFVVPVAVLAVVGAFLVAPAGEASATAVPRPLVTGWLPYWTPTSSAAVRYVRGTAVANVSQVGTDVSLSGQLWFRRRSGAYPPPMQTVVLTKRRAVDFCRVGSCACLPS